MNRRYLVAAAAVSAILVVVLVAVLAFGGSDAPSTTEPQTTEAETVSTLAPGEPPPPGTAIVVQQLSPECTDGVKGLRELMDAYTDGYSVDEAGTEKMNLSLAKARTSCPAEEWQRFYDKEFRGWLSPADASVTAGRKSSTTTAAK